MLSRGFEGKKGVKGIFTSSSSNSPFPLQITHGSPFCIIRLTFVSSVLLKIPFDLGGVPISFPVDRSPSTLAYLGDLS